MQNGCIQQDHIIIVQPVVNITRSIETNAIWWHILYGCWFSRRKKGREGERGGQYMRYTPTGAQLRCLRIFHLRSIVFCVGIRTLHTSYVLEHKTKRMIGGCKIYGGDQSEVYYIYVSLSHIFLLLYSLQREVGNISFLYAFVCICVSKKRRQSYN